MSDLYYGSGYSGTGDYTGVSSVENSLNSLNDPNRYNTRSSTYVASADPYFSNDFFTQYPNASNPYYPTYQETIYYTTYQIIGYNQYGNPIYGPVTQATIVTRQNPAYTDFENKATSYQNSYYYAQTESHQNQLAIDKADFISSYGKIPSRSIRTDIKSSSIKNDIQTLADLKAQLNELEFEDDITKYLNRVPDTDHTQEKQLLINQINTLENKLSKDLADYWRTQENILRETSINPNVGTSWLTDPYFGRSGGEFRVGSNIEQSVQQNQSTFLNLYTSGEMGDWMAGGNMYDSPRAGNILFNPLGSLNTTVFLGLDNQNFSPSLPATLANPEVFKKFGTLAGDIGFSVVNFGIKN